MPEVTQPYFIAGKIMSGLGMFFIGIKMISANLRLIAGRKVRHFLAKLTERGWASGLLGITLGGIAQSAAAVTFIMVSTISAGLITVRRAMPVVLFSNIGISLLVFLVAIDIHLLAFYLLGLLGILYYFELHRVPMLRPAIGALLGVALLLYGLLNIQDGARPLQEYAWFTHALEMARQSSLYGFLAAIGLTLVVSSSVTVSVVAITLADAGILNLQDLIMIIYGTNLGMALTTWWMSAKFHGAARQLAMFQVFTRIFTATCLVSLFYVEVYFKVPLMAALVTSLSSDVARQAAFVFLFFQIYGALTLSFFLSPVYKLLDKLYPITVEEELSKPQYIYDQAMQEPATALDLVHLEQLRILKRLPKYCDALRVDCSEVEDLKLLHRSTMSLCKEVEAFLTELIDRTPSRQILERSLNLQNRGELLKTLEENLYEIADQWCKTGADPIRDFTKQIAESLHALLLTTIDAVESHEDDDIQLALMVSGDRGNLMESIHRRILETHPTLDDNNQHVLFTITGRFERVIWMIRQLSKLAERANENNGNGFSRKVTEVGVIGR